MPRPATGTIVTSADGRRRARITLPDKSRPWVAVPNGATEKQARDFARGVSDVAREGDGVRVRKVANESTRKWCERWVAEKKARGQVTHAIESHMRTHLERFIGGTPIAHVTPHQLEKIVEHLDGLVRDGKLKWKAALNIWGTVTKMFDDAHRSKVLSLRVREDNPAKGVRGPDRGVPTEKVHLYPSEFLKLMACKDVPVFRRRYYAIAIYNYLRPGELEALRWEDIDLDRGTIQIRRSVRRATGKEKSPKAGRARLPFDLEPNIIPLLQKMHDESEGIGRVFGDLGDERALAETLRADLKRAGVDRPELHHRSVDPPREWMTMHDCRTTGITWMAVRGDQPLVIMARAGHADLKQTQGYIDSAVLIRRGYGEVFPQLIKPKVSSTESSTRMGETPQVGDDIDESGGSAWESNPPAAP